MDSSRFYQAKVWTDAQGVEHKIKKMDPGHVKNVIAMLHRRAEDIAMREYLRESRYVNQDTMGEAAYDSVSSSLDEMLDNPHRWLENTPLMQELVRVDLRNERRIARQYGIPRPYLIDWEDQAPQDRVGKLVEDLLGGRKS